MNRKNFRFVSGTLHSFLYLGLALAATLTSCEKDVTPELSISVDVLNVGQAASNPTFVVTTNVDWTASSSNADWCVLSPANGNQSATVTVQIAANPGFDTRTATITVRAAELSKTITVTQLGMVPSVLIDPTTYEAPYGLGTFEVTITANGSWTLASTQDWCILSAAAGTNNQKVTVTHLLNMNISPRNASIILTHEKGATATLAVTQLGQPASRHLDSLTLVDFYNRTDGANWSKEKWDLTTPMDSWTGITVNEDGRVTILKINTNVISTAAPLIENIGNLSELKELRLGSCKISGTIPAGVYSLTKLTHLLLNNNSLTGPISARIGDLTELEQLNFLNNTGINGSIPSEIGQLTNLNLLYLSGTAVSGTIPTSFANLVNMADFGAFSTKLEGPLPDVFGKWKNLRTFLLHRIPTMTGALPPSLGNVTTSQTNLSIHLYECNFTGNIPASYGNLPEVCAQLRLQGNQLSGKIPDEVKAHPSWSSKWNPDVNIYPQQEGFILE